MSVELSNYLVSWVVAYWGDLQPTYIGVTIYLLSSMDILVPGVAFWFNQSSHSFLNRQVDEERAQRRRQMTPERCIPGSVQPWPTLSVNTVDGQNPASVDR